MPSQIQTQLSFKEIIAHLENHHTLPAGLSRETLEEVRDAIPNESISHDIVVEALNLLY